MLETYTEFDGATGRAVTFHTMEHQPSIQDGNWLAVGRLEGFTINTKTGELIQPVAVDDTADKLKAIKAIASRLIFRTQWLVDRHRDEVEANRKRHMTDDEYQSLLQYRQAVRDASNRLETMQPVPDNYSDDQWWPNVT